MEQVIKRAYYSQKAADIHGTVFWKDMDGKDVEVTAVVSIGNDDSYMWDDKIDRGLVVRWSKDGLRRGF